MSIRDHLSDLSWRAANGRTRVRNAWWRAAGRRIDGARTARRNERNHRTLERGSLPRRDRVAAEVKSRTPIYRDRVNPATGRPHRDDARLHRQGNESLARMKATRASAERSAAMIFGIQPRDAAQERALRKEARDRQRASVDAAVARWDDPLPGERRRRQDPPSHRAPRRTR